jgi:hypothetical protein
MTKKRSLIIVISLLCIVGLVYLGLVYLSIQRSELLIEENLAEKGAPDEPLPNNTIPSFPWPPPKASAFEKLSNTLLKTGTQKTLLLNVAKRLETAFDHAGYGERSYHAVPNGFALVSRMEQINLDGTPKNMPDRWSVGSKNNPKSISLVDYIKVLFNAPKGHYRVIVFIVTDMPFSASSAAPTEKESEEWIHDGSVALPQTIAKRMYSENYYTTALIYEFERLSGDTGAVLKVPSDLLGKDHLQKAGILTALME